MSETRTDRRVSTRTALFAAAVALVLLLGGVLAIVDALAGDSEGEPGVAANTQLSEEAYAAVEVGEAKEAVLARLRPADPVDSAVLAEYQLRSPETPAAECVYYESAGGVADDLYRFCFVEDRLVDKTVVLPPEDGVTG